MTTTFEPGLLDAMLRMLQRRGVPAVAVPAYRECSYNIGYCETCSEIVTEVRVYWNNRLGALAHWDYYGDLGELIRELTDEPEKMLAAAVRESEDERWDHIVAHSLDEALMMVPDGEAA